MSNQQMIAEIVCVLRRNWNKNFLHAVLTRALILEEILVSVEERGQRV